MSGGNNGKVLTDSLKSHHPIETLFREDESVFFFNIQRS